MDYIKCPDLDKNLPLATAFIRIQYSNKIFDTPSESLSCGTVFPVLYGAGYHQPKEDDNYREGPICHTSK